MICMHEQKQVDCMNLNDLICTYSHDDFNYKYPVNYDHCPFRHAQLCQTCKVAMSCMHVWDEIKLLGIRFYEFIINIVITIKGIYCYNIILC
jgi:hypothetical protein